MNLETFYKSKEWEKLVERLRIERVNESGELICEYCGNPIVRKYDCIGHHKIELNEENVQDAEISLNPDNIVLIHFRCHNMIHQRFEGFRQKVYLVYGAPCSGKSEFIRKTAFEDDLVVDIDRIYDAISNGGRYSKERNRRTNRIKQNAFGVRDCLYDQIRTRTGRWRNAYIVGGFPLRNDRDRLCDLLRAEPVYIQATKEECIERAIKERPDNWIGFINEWFENFVE